MSALEQARHAADGDAGQGVGVQRRRSRVQHLYLQYVVQSGSRTYCSHGHHFCFLAFLLFQIASRVGAPANNSVPTLNTSPPVCRYPSLFVFLRLPPSPPSLNQTDISQTYAKRHHRCANNPLADMTPTDSSVRREILRRGKMWPTRAWHPAPWWD